MNLTSELTVLELASVLAGPAVGMFFAELGAKVIKVENARTGGDVTRQWRNTKEGTEDPASAYYASINYGKTVYLMDLREQAAQDQIHEWLQETDVLISNFRPTAAKKLGLDAERLRKQYPQLIYAELDGYGDGSGRPAYDVVLQAESGYLSMCGHAGQPAAKMPVALIDILAAHQLKEGILLALWRRERTKQGAYVKTSLLGSAIAALANQASNYLNTGLVPGKIGTQHPNIAPYGDLFTAADGKQFVLAVGNDQQFERLCEVTGLTSLPTDAKFQDNTARLKHRTSLCEHLAGAFLQKDRTSWMDLFEKAAVPAGSLRNMAEVFEDTTNHRFILSDKCGSKTDKRMVRTVVFSVE